MGIMYELKGEVNKSVIDLKPFVDEVRNQVDSANDALNLLDYIEKQWHFLIKIRTIVNELQSAINCFINSLEEDTDKFEVLKIPETGIDESFLKKVSDTWNSIHK